MVVSIHQANFVPWYPFFQKIERSDIFVVMVNCQFEKSNYQNRFNIGKDWYTMSVNQKMSDLIRDKTYVSPQSDWDRIKKKLKAVKKGYDLSFLDAFIGQNLSVTNVAIIRRIAEALGIKTKIIQDWPTKLLKTERLVDICCSLGATTYLSGISGKHYLDLAQFAEKGIAVDFQSEDAMIKTPIVEMLHGKTL